MTNTNYGKLVDGALVYANTPITINDIPTWTNDPAIYAAEGYLPVVRSDMPKQDGYWYEMTYVEQDGAIVQTWIEHEIPVPEPTDEISDSEALAIITGGVTV